MESRKQLNSSNLCYEKSYRVQGRKKRFSDKNTDSNSKKAESVETSSNTGKTEAAIQSEPVNMKEEVQNTHSDADNNWSSSRKFFGYFGHTYDKFLDFFLARQEQCASNHSTLGAISPDPEYYFVESEASRNYAGTFLANFWAKKKNYDLTIQEHQSRQATRNIQSEQFPNCISFIDATVTSYKFGKETEKKFCFIALSGETHSKELMNAIKDEVREHNARGEEPEMVLLTGDTRSYNKLLKFISRNADYRYLPCAEKTFGLFLLKAFMEMNIQVKGCVNCDFYPYQKGVRYGSQPNSQDPTVKPPLRKSGSLILSDEQTLVPLKPCCQDCQQNRSHFLSLCKAAQLYKQAAKPKEQRSLSPLRNSIRSYSSLLTHNPVFNQSERRSKSTTNDKKDKPRFV